MLLVVVNVPGDYSLWPVLKVIMYGRFWVTAEAQNPGGFVSNRRVEST